MIIEEYTTMRQGEYFAYISRSQAQELIATLSDMLLRKNPGSRKVTVSRVLGHVHPYVNIIMVTDSAYNEYLNKE